MEMTTIRSLIFKGSHLSSAGCWEWRSTNNCGYGLAWYKGAMHRAHRLSYLAFKGPIEDKHVLHHCDNPRCVCPDHLWLGTHADNMRDKARKLRGTGKLTAEQVSAIRADDRPQSVLAAEYGVSQSQISRAKTGQNYKDI